MNDATWSIWPAPAKINLFLRITGQRADGYHNLQTVFQLLEWGDTLKIRVREDGRIARENHQMYEVPEEQDIVVRAARLLQVEGQCALGADIQVVKQIPLGGGFGGGSSDAASVLVALNFLWKLALSNEQLVAIGLKLGADVPVFVRGLNAWAEGIGEILTPIQLPEAWFLLIDSGVHVPTVELFQSTQLTRTQKLVKIASYVNGSLLDNAFEPIVRQRQPRINRVFESMSHYGTVALTGTGGGCFMRFSSKEEALKIQAQLPDDYRSWVVKSASESPLLQALRLQSTND
ncbi:MAG: 4-(cytidine 5'-diphospho)-2-C-methyl-D-erythritol kinase [Arenimonas sp.]|nr:4-(cytidine 5'-diphospho)-2-C-methyl-D-erythritol kinase [Arenimonas sp.]